MNEHQTPDEIQQKPPFSSSAEVDLVAKALLQIERGQRITWDEISEIINEDARTPRGRSIIGRAKKRVEITHGIVMRSISGIGYERCDEPAKIELSKENIQGIRRKVRKGEAIINTVEIDKLEHSELEMHNLNRAVFGLLRQASGSQFRRALQKRLSDSQTNLENANLLRLFRKKNEGDEA
jgi:hypothetical protein